MVIDKKEKITKEQIEEYFQKNFYVSTDLLTYYTVIGINLISEGKVRVGQDIYTTTLDGPAGAGKSMYAKLYAKMVHELLGKDVAFISYQCDDSTSKIELFEDINVGAAVASEPEKVNIPGVLARAIIEAEKGKKVVLFIDEYDKTREQVDSLFLQMLQDGIINTNQFGDLKISDENKGNIQVIFCKNDLRTDLTEPLTRRTRMVYLDIMKPTDFYDLAMRRLYNETEDKQELTIIKLVCLLYEEVYKHRDEYQRVCAVSELFGAIQDLTDLCRIEAPNYILYETLIGDLFKNKVDRGIFETGVPNITTPALKNTLTALKIKKETEEEKRIIDIFTEELKAQAKIDAEKVLEEERKALATKDSELEQERENLKKKQEALEQEKIAYQAKMEKYLKEVEVKFNELLAKKSSETTIPRSSYFDEYALNFSDKSNRIRRGRNVFESLEEPVLVATLSIPLKELNNEDLVALFLDNNGIIYENGFLLTEPYKIMVVRTKPDIDGKVVFSFYMENAYLIEDSKIPVPDYFDQNNNKPEPNNPYIKNIIESIIKLLLELNKSDLHEKDFNPLEKIYNNNYNPYISSENIFQRVIKKVEQEELPF